MAHIILSDAQAYAEPTKLTFSTLEATLESFISQQVLDRLRTRFEEVSTWVDENTTPKLIKNIIAMSYVSWLYSRQFSEDEAGSNEYALRLLQTANELIQGLIDGTVLLDPGQAEGVGGDLSFYPTDNSSDLEPTSDDPSLGPEKFSMGQIW